MCQIVSVTNQIASNKINSRRENTSGLSKQFWNTPVTYFNLFKTEQRRKILIWCLQNNVSLNRRYLFLLLLNFVGYRHNSMRISSQDKFDVLRSKQRQIYYFSDQLHVLSDRGRKVVILNCLFLLSRVRYVARAIMFTRVWARAHARVTMTSLLGR